MKIIVTQEHINNGSRCDGQLCPIALALKEAGLPDLYVHGKVVEWIGAETEEEARWAKLPREAQAFIYYFDALGPGAITPFEFELNEL